MPLQATSGAASYDGFGGGVVAEPNYIESCFSTYLYTGNGSTQTITNGIDLAGKGGMVWFKGRSAITLPLVQDTVRGATSVLFTDRVNAASTATDRITSFNSNGVSIGSSSNLNSNGTTYVAWTFRKQPKFFDVVTWTANSSGTGQAVPHNLGSIPGCIIVKALTSSSWFVWNIASGITAARTGFQLNTTDASASSVNSTGQMTSTEFFSGQIYDTDLSRPVTDGTTYVAYLFAHNAGGFGLSGTDNVISCGSFSTDGSGNATVSLGYEPQWLMYKCSSSVGDWEMVDVMRGWVVGVNNDNGLRANSSDAESTGSNRGEPSSTGFNCVSFPTNRDFIYIAIRRGPMKVPTSGTSVFNPYTATLSAGTAVNAGLTPDLLIGKYRAGTDAPRWVDRLRGFANATGGANPQLRSDTTDAEVSSTAWSYNWNNTGYVIGNALNGLNSVIYSLSRAPGFFDEVCYTGNATSGATQTHNLGVTPELMIVKGRSVNANWFVYSQTLGATKYLILNDTGGSGTLSSVWNDTAPTSTTFTLGNAGAVNASGGTYVAYLFASCPGVSKVGSYTGTGATQTISCGFTGGARFVMIKRTDSTGDWYYWDTARGMVSGTDPYLLMNSNVGETNTNSIYTTTGGFQIVSTAAGINASGGTYIYLAIA